jgi:protein-disulfide isomerase
MSTAGDDAQDLTRKQRREQARAQRRELEQAQAASAARRTRLIQLGIVGAVVVAAIIGIVIATSGGKSSHVASTPQAKNKVASEVNGLLGGIPQSGSVLGNANAPVTLVFFGDLQCPICRDFSLGVLPGLVQNYVRAGKLRIEYRSLETATREPETFRKQQIAALAGGSQSKMWYYTELFYHQQGEENSEYVNEEFLSKLASEVPGLDIAKWRSDRNNPAFENTLLTDAQTANNQGLSGTPSFLLGKTGSQPKKFEPSSYSEPSSYYAAIERQLKG